MVLMLLLATEVAPLHYQHIHPQHRVALESMKECKVLSKNKHLATERQIICGLLHVRSNA